MAEHTSTMGFSAPPPNADAMPTADIKFPSSHMGYRHAAYPVKRPEVEINEFMVECRASTLLRCRERLVLMLESRFPWHEFLLTIFSLSLGVFLGSLSSDIDYNKDSYIWKMLFVFLPLVSAGAGTAYFFVRHQSVKSAAVAAREILDELPDPKNSR